MRVPPPHFLKVTQETFKAAALKLPSKCSSYIRYKQHFQIMKGKKEHHTAKLIHIHTF